MDSTPDELNVRRRSGHAAPLRIRRFWRVGIYPGLYTLSSDSKSVSCHTRLRFSPFREVSCV
jgi:hypothetical protein